MLHRDGLTIADDGKRFDITRTGRKSGGLGLLSITKRVRLPQGIVNIVTVLNKGTRVQIRIPLKSPAGAATIGTDERSAF